PETVSEINLLELFADREDIRVQGYDDHLHQAIENAGAEQVAQSACVAVRRLQGTARRAPLSVAAFQRIMATANLTPDPKALTLYCWQKRYLPAILTLTEDLGEFLGFWTADGCYTRKGVRLASNLDEVDQIEGLCQRLFCRVTRYSK